MEYNREEEAVEGNLNVEEKNGNSEQGKGQLQFNGISFKKLRSQDMIGQSFSSLKEASDFYQSYARTVGFGVRKDALRICKSHNEVGSRQWYCSCQGTRNGKKNGQPRKRSPKKSTRTGCLARLRVNYDTVSKRYNVTKFEATHNHDLVPEADCNLIPSSRKCKDADVAHAQVMRSVSIRTCHTYEYMVDQMGGYLQVPFTAKDLYNKLDAARRDIMFEGDTESALSYLSGEGAGDQQFYCRFSVDEDDRLCNLFWRDSTALIDYSCFGDVLLFDSTYKTNCYDKPLVLFVGSSNHLTTVVFGCALLMDETIESYKWVLETFLSSMDGKKPKAVLTDSDEAMRSAIEKVLPECPHRLCSWHIGKNVTDHIKCPDLGKVFRKLMWGLMPPAEFEDK